jgi:hypothetical protein
MVPEMSLKFLHVGWAVEVEPRQPNSIAGKVQLKSIECCQIYRPLGGSAGARWGVLARVGSKGFGILEVLF